MPVTSCVRQCCDDRAFGMSPEASMISSTSNIFRSVIAVVALVAGFVMLMRAATAQEEGKLDPAQDAAFMQRVFAAAPGKDKTYACFTRVYDAPHLAAHPKQKVSAMKLLVTSEIDD